MTIQPSIEERVTQQLLKPRCPYYVAIPALQPIVHDLFVLRARSKSESSKDLETQREVVVSMLLRLLQYHQVWNQVCFMLPRKVPMTCVMFHSLSVEWNSDQNYKMLCPDYFLVCLKLDLISSQISSKFTVEVVCYLLCIPLLSIVKDFRSKLDEI